VAHNAHARVPIARRVRWHGRGIDAAAGHYRVRAARAGIDVAVRQARQRHLREVGDVALVLSIESKVRFNCTSAEGVD